MPFLSIEFALFFLLFLPLYWLCRPSPRLQNLLLLAAGLGWLVYIAPLAALALAAFSLAVSLLAQLLTRSRSTAARRWWLGAGVVLALANLVFFKFSDFFRPLLQQHSGSTLPDILMPLGISYYTFQGIAYLVALYRGQSPRLGTLQQLLHFGFFPTITSGPIIRAAAFKGSGGRVEAGMADQIRTAAPRDMVKPALAVSLIVLGIAKKWWLAGTLGESWVDPVFENPLQYDAPSVLAAVYGYTVQLFMDFSGYSDLVIGMAMLLGFRLPENFNMPLRAYNIRDFWDRWHITLSTWIRDYIYIPLGGSRHGFTRTQINLMLAMLLSGIWHGQGWNFLLWGALHGAALVLLNIGDKIGGRREILAASRIGRLIGILFTLHFVCFSFVVFRTASLSDAALVFQSLAGQGAGWRMPELPVAALLVLFAAALAAYGLLARAFRFASAALEKLPVWLWWLPLTAAMVLLMVLAPSGIPGFIYANF